MAALGGDGLRLLSVSGPASEPESAALSGAGPGLCCWVSVCSCLSLACSYVGSLYVWKSELPRHIPVHSDGRQAGGHLPGRSVAAAADHDPVPGSPDAALLGLSLGLGQWTEGSPGPPGLGAMPDGHALAAQPGDRPPDGGAGVPGLHAAHVGPLHGPGPGRLHLPPLLWRRVPVLLHGCLRGVHGLPLHPHGSPDRAGPLSLFLQLHGLPGRVRGPGAPPEVPAAAGLRPGRGALRPAAAAPHRAQAVQQPPPLPAPGPGWGLSRPLVLLTSAPSLRTLGAPGERGGVRGGGLGTGAS
uniref:Ras converting CAAX endopeptidase 1 n=1 Tax=Sarcophilus harrisii TaxID=9305 RepID=A0A7N4NH67_SARHA